MLIDLQFHSTYSDGYLTPTKLAELMAHNKVKVASLTDHNTVGGLEEFRIACSKKGIKVIAGMELYVKLNGRKLNILWYNFNENDPDLHKMLRDSQIRKKRRARNVLNALVERGFKLDVNKMLDKHTHYIPINHLVDDFWADSFNKKKIRKELESDTPRESEIIKEYFYNKKNICLQESYIKIDRIFKLKEKIGGQIVLCHPGKHNGMSRKFFGKLKALGLDGAEVLSPHHSIGAVMYAQYLSREFDLIETGGSDFHRFEGGGYPIQSSSQYFKIDSKYLRGIEKIIA